MLILLLIIIFVILNLTIPRGCAGNFSRRGLVRKKMSDLPPLSLGTSPWSTTHRYVPIGGGRKPSREDSLLSSLDEVRTSTKSENIA